jgi:hypothetical protein
MHIFVWFALSLLVWVDDAQAYIDPGTGSMVIQSAVAAITAGFFVIKTYWHKIKTFFSRKKNIKLELERDQDNE